MPTKRSYGDPCGVARALDLVGERWALLIVRDLLLGPKRFTDLQVGLTGVPPNVLTTRLNDLREAGVVRKRTLPPPAASQVYELTEWGAGLKPIVLALGLWGAQSPVSRPEGEMGTDSLMLSMLGALEPAAFAPGGGVFDVRLGRESFTVSIGEDVQITRGNAPVPTGTVINTDAATLAALMAGEVGVDAAVAAGRVRLEGDTNACRALLAAVWRSDDSARAHPGV
ncbi:helix-turn-helix domain-containing protein [Kibdelosporangium persicum]|uniref:Helix-turn-helix transcriptional regulator n=1 Tax=Kibdelosporangium persicum TaxID=2698649 RepID=A0ABX2F997_9PSEU|nr:helix-turn-helix domain-containing protein [Kibdelosporangium persicum]NRN67365.1 Helix-turn-helix transcriptional regulator [Kibdelosporangium persicum]